MKYQSSAEDLADAILAAGMEGFKFKIESLTARKIMMKIDKK